MVTAVISIIVGAIISYLIAKWQMKKNKIVHFSINSYDIGKGLSDEFPDFKLHFAGEALADNVMVLKGGFMNTGKNDIDGLKGENDIKMILPKECKIKAITVSPSTDGLTITATKDDEKDNILSFGISEIFKTDEYFRYTAIVEMSNGFKDISEAIEYHHRIKDTSKIYNLNIGERRSPVKRKRFIYYTAFIFFLCILEFILSLYPGVHYKIIDKKTNKEVSVHVDPSSNIYVCEGIHIPFVSGSVISCKEFENNYKIETNTEFKWSNTITFVSIIQLLLVMPLLFGLYYFGWGKYSHISKVIAKNEIKKSLLKT